MIEMPEWNKYQQAFQIAESALNAAKKGKKAQPPKGKEIASGVPVNLVSVPPSILVDFEGGRKQSVAIAGTNITWIRRRSIYWC